MLEKQGKVVNAVLYELKPGAGFVTDRQLASGRYFPGRQAFLLPIGPAAALTDIEDWVAMKGAYFEVPVSARPTNLVANLRSPGLPDMPMEFRRWND